jgi:hypothetical protein
MIHGHGPVEVVQQEARYSVRSLATTFAMK